LRLAVDTTSLFGARTGVAAFTEGALHALARRPDVDVHAYAVTWRGTRGLAGMVPSGVTVARRPMAARPLRSLWCRFDAPPIEWWTGPADVCHGTNFVVPPTRRAAAVATVHDLTPVRYPELSTRDTLQYPRLLRRALGRGAWVHTPSAFIAAEVVELLGAAAERVRAVHHGVPPVAIGDGRLGREVAGSDRYVLALGTIEPRKDLPTLVRAFDSLAASDPALRLVVAGPDGWGIEAFGEVVARARHGSRVVRLGWVNGAVRSGLLAGAAAFAYPSLYEGFGFPPLEAMQVGVPVVATTAGALPEVLGDAARLVTPRDVDGLAAALADVLEDQAVRDDLVSRGRVRAASYSWDRCGEGLTAIYRDAMEDR
jgi:glycosyltransferase involved in cell wall biosynthesis